MNDKAFERGFQRMMEKEGAASALIPALVGHFGSAGVPAAASLSSLSPWAIMAAEIAAGIEAVDTQNEGAAMRDFQSLSGEDRGKKILNLLMNDTTRDKLWNKFVNSKSLNKKDFLSLSKGNLINKLDDARAWEDTGFANQLDDALTDTSGIAYTAVGNTGDLQDDFGRGFVSQSIGNFKHYTEKDKQAIQAYLNLYNKQTKHLPASDRLSYLKNLIAQSNLKPEGGGTLYTPEQQEIFNQGLLNQGAFKELTRFEQGMNSQLENQIFNPKYKYLQKQLLDTYLGSEEHIKPTNSEEGRKQKIKDIHNNLPDEDEEEANALKLSDIPLAGAGIGGGLGYLIPKLTGLGADVNKKTGETDVPWYLPALGAGVGALGEYGYKKGLKKSSSFKDREFAQGFAQGLANHGITKKAHLKMILKSMGYNIKHINLCHEKSAFGPALPINTSQETPGFGDMVMSIVPQVVAPILTKTVSQGAKEKKYTAAINQMVRNKFKNEGITNKNYVSRLGIDPSMSLKGYMDKLTAAVYTKTQENLKNS